MIDDACPYCGRTSHGFACYGLMGETVEDEGPYGIEPETVMQAALRIKQERNHGPYNPSTFMRTRRK